MHAESARAESFAMRDVYPCCNVVGTKAITEFLFDIEYLLAKRANDLGPCFGRIFL